MSFQRLASMLCATLFMLFLWLGCNKASQQQARQQFGTKIDAAAPKVTLAELVAHPDRYEGQSVVVDGQFNGACSDGADFYFKDKFDMIEADPPQPEVMSLSKGTPIRLYGIVKVRHSRAEENEKEEREASDKRGEKREKQASGEAAEVKIAAKGLEVLK